MSLVLLILASLLTVNGFTSNPYQSAQSSNTESYFAIQTATNARFRSIASRSAYRQTIATRQNGYDTTPKPKSLSSMLHQSSSSNDEDASSNSRSLLTIGSLGIVSFLYWYWLVLGAAAHASGLPFIPDWLPMTPGWPPSEADLAPAIEDSIHFFYLSDLLQTTPVDVPNPPPLRLGLFNIAEAWIFAFLPLLWADRENRLPRPVLLGTWLGALGLTNAFLAPYLLCCEIFKQPVSAEKSNSANSSKNAMVAGGTAVTATLVVIYSMIQILTQTNGQDFADFFQLVQEDRTYFAFCIDLFLFSIFQSVLLGRVKETDLTAMDKLPFLGLVKWSLVD